MGLWRAPRLLYRVLSGSEEAMLGNMAPGLVSLSLSRSRSMSMSLSRSRGATPFFLWVWGNELCYDLRQVWSAFELC